MPRWWNGPRSQCKTAPEGITFAGGASPLPGLLRVLWVLTSYRRQEGALLELQLACRPIWSV